MKLKGLVLLAVLAALFAYLWLKPEPPLELPLGQVQQGRVEALVANTRAGTVKACRRAYLSLSIGGPIDRLTVTEGDRVEQGQLMLALWQDDLKAALAQAEAAIEASARRIDQQCLLASFADREVARVEGLMARKLASPQQLDDAQTRAKAQHAACEAARAEQRQALANRRLVQAQLTKSELRAPFAGVVAEVNGEVGEYLIPSPPGVATLPAIDLIDDGCLYVSAPIDEVDAARIGLGQAVHVTLDAFPGRRFAGQVRRIAPYVLDLEKQARTVAVEVTLLDGPEDQPLLVGYSADVEIVTATVDDGLWVPAEALLPDDSLYRVDSQGRLEQVQVQTGLRNWQQVVITGGLARGELILLRPNDPAVAPGKRVAVHD
ncbi:efflux RND transporter periplasmic adaptor subunit [Gallaecimonas sp. GXIMD4217]|uniref:efflux RND transporter periplasmic adaptor subunit n=1 Tax=Gallaecimonas sp. GXIMD4217 TaxID=3131927 RepID=UPI00311B3C7E